MKPPYPSQAKQECAHSSTRHLPTGSGLSTLHLPLALSVPKRIYPDSHMDKTDSQRNPHPSHSAVTALALPGSEALSHKMYASTPPLRDCEKVPKEKMKDSRPSISAEFLYLSTCLHHSCSVTSCPSAMECGGEGEEGSSVSRDLGLPCHLVSVPATAPRQTPGRKTEKSKQRAVRRWGYNKSRAVTPFCMSS